MVDRDVRVLTKCDHSQAWKITSGHSLHTPVSGSSSPRSLTKCLICMTNIVEVFSCTTIPLDTPRAFWITRACSIWVSFG